VNLPRVRISVTMAEYCIIQPGLNSLVNGLASAKLGSYPNRHAYDRIDLEASNIHSDRAFDPSMAQRTFNLKAGLAEMIGTRKARLDVFELATAALAARVSKTLARQKEGLLPDGTTRLLAAKLERYRKQAKRATIARLGNGDYEALSKVWSAHLKWIRYNLTQFTVAKPTRYDGNPLWQEQREALALMITEALRERYCAPLPQEQLIRIALLAKNALRRGRLTMTLRELLTAGRRGRDVLYDFVEKRVDLDALAGADVPPAIACMLRADKFTCDGTVPHYHYALC
jgi:hypothetical protein